MDVEFVEAYEVASVHIDGDDEGAADVGDARDVLTLTTDAAGAPIVGARCARSVGKAPVTGEGERLGYYTYNPNLERRLSTVREGVQSSLVAAGLALSRRRRAA